MRLPLMPDAGESCHVSRHESSKVVSVFGMVGAHVWCGVKLPYSSSTITPYPRVAAGEPNKWKGNPSSRMMVKDRAI